MKKGIATSVSTFENIIKENLMYVDKTKYLYNLITSEDVYYFLSRPRRFGKSLTISTLEAIFKGKKELFKNLYIGQTDYEFKEYPVMRFDFSQCQYTTKEGIDMWLNDRLLEIAKIYNVSVVSEKRISADNFALLIQELSKKEKVVVLIDEYDNRLTENYEKENILEIRDVFRGFFSVLKSLGDCLRFVLLTGVTKYAKMGVFSSLNNLNDISLDEEYGTMLGFTQKELEENFKEYIDDGVKANRTSRKSYLKEMKDTYDGYLFAPGCETVYNPVSINMFFSKGGSKFNNYWAETGGNTKLIMDVAKKVDFDVVADLTTPLSRDILTAYDIIDMAGDNTDVPLLKSLLFQAGYLTIDRPTSPSNQSFYLRFPNFEVERTFVVGLVGVYLSETSRRIAGSYDTLSLFEAGKLDEAMKVLKQTYASVPSNLKKDLHEASYQMTFCAIMISCGGTIDAEEYTNKGRIDATLKTKKHTYIFEFKLDKSADEALAQIKDKQYYEKYVSPKKGNTIHLVGINFSTKERNITDYKEEIVN